MGVWGGGDAGLAVPPRGLSLQGAQQGTPRLVPVRVAVMYPPRHLPHPSLELSVPVRAELSWPARGAVGRSVSSG